MILAAFRLALVVLAGVVLVLPSAALMGVPEQRILGAAVAVLHGRVVAV